MAESVSSGEEQVQDATVFVGRHSSPYEKALLGGFVGGVEGDGQSILPQKSLAREDGFWFPNRGACIAEHHISKQEELLQWETVKDGTYSQERPGNKTDAL